MRFSGKLLSGWTDSIANYSKSTKACIGGTYGWDIQIGKLPCNLQVLKVEFHFTQSLSYLVSFLLDTLLDGCTFELVNDVY